MAMQGKRWLLKAAAEAAVITTAAGFALAFCLPSRTIAGPSGAEEILVIAAAFVPGGIAALWMFRRVQVHRTRRDARAVAIAFAVFTPISLAVASVLAVIPGGYADLLLGGPFGLIGAFLGIVVIITIFGFVLSVLALNRRGTKWRGGTGIPT